MQQDPNVMHVNLYVLCPIPIYYIIIYLDVTLIIHPNVGWRINCAPNSRRIPCNQTHCVVALTVSLHSASADESEMVCCFLLDQQIGPSTNMKTKLMLTFCQLDHQPNLNQKIQLVAVRNQLCSALRTS